MLPPSIARMEDIDTFQQFMHTSRRHGHGGLIRLTPPRDIGESSRLKTLQAEPESTVLPDQGFQAPTIPTQEDEAVAVIRILAEFLAHHGRQGVDTPSHVLETARYEYPSDSREGQHGRRRRRHRATARTRSAGTRSPISKTNPLAERTRTTRRRLGRPGMGRRMMTSTNPVGDDVSMRLNHGGHDEAVDGGVVGRVQRRQARLHHQRTGTTRRARLKLCPWYKRSHCKSRGPGNPPVRIRAGGGICHEKLSDANASGS